MPQDRAPNFNSRWERRAFLEREADRAEWAVPEGRIGGVIRQLRRRAGAATRRSNVILGALLGVIGLGIVFYLGQPFFRLYVDGQRVALQQTLDSTAQTAADLRMDMQAQAEAYAHALRQGFLVLDSPTGSTILGHVAVGESLLFYGHDGTLLRTSGDGTGGQVIDTPTDALLHGHVSVGDDLLFYGEGGMLLRTSGDGTGGQVLDTPEQATLRGHVALSDGLLFYGDDGTLLRTAADGTGGQLIDVQTAAGLRGHVAIADDLLFYGDRGTLLRTDWDGTIRRLFALSTRSALRGHVSIGNDLLFYGIGGTLLRTESDGMNERSIATPTNDWLVGHVLIGEDLFFYGSGGTLLVTSANGTGGQLIETPTQAWLYGHVAVGDDLLFYGQDGTLLRWGDMFSREVLGRISDLATTNTEAYDDSVVNAPRDIAIVHDTRNVLNIHRDELDDFHKPRVEPMIAAATALGGQAIPIGDRWTEASQGLTNFYRIPFSLVWNRERDDFAEFLTDCRAGHVAGTTSPEDADVRTPPSPHSESLTKACLEGWNARQAALAQTWWQSIAAQLPPGILLLFLLATLGGLYRYNLRLAGFHHSRADALEVLAEAGAYDAETLTQVADALAADKVEFGKGNTPSDQAVEIARSIVARK